MADTNKKVTKKPTKQTEVKAKDLQAMSLADLQKELAGAREQQLESLKSHRNGELVNPHVLTVQRKSIARIMTAINKAKKEENS